MVTDGEAGDPAPKGTVEASGEAPSGREAGQLFREEALAEFARTESGADELELADRRFVWILWAAAAVLIAVGAVLIWPLVARFAG